MRPVIGPRVVPHRIEASRPPISSWSGRGSSEARGARRGATVDRGRGGAVVELRTSRSPIDGVVVNRRLSPGDLADPPQLVELVAIDPLYVEVFAPLSAWGKIEVGAIGTDDNATVTEFFEIGVNEGVSPGCGF